ncbi:MAG TPA: DUF4446 family protein [bacterium]|nr:DUF4446 family protein [bacterium]
MFELFKKENEIEPKDLRQVISQFKNLKKDFKEMSIELNNLKKESKFSVQKVGVVRFNPFKNQGGNQSFSVALLDGNNDGIIITSFYNRNGNRIFGKPIKKGRSIYILSEEEKSAIEKAKKTRINRKEI